MKNLDSDEFIRSRRKLFLIFNMVAMIFFSASLFMYTNPFNGSFTITALIAMIGVYYFVASIYNVLYENRPMTIFVTVLCLNIIGVFLRSILEWGEYSFSHYFTVSYVLLYLLINSISVTSFYLIMQLLQNRKFFSDANTKN